MKPDTTNTWTGQERDEERTELQCPKCGQSNIRTTLTDDKFVYGERQEAVELVAQIPLRTCTVLRFPVSRRRCRGRASRGRVPSSRCDDTDRSAHSEREVRVFSRCVRSTHKTGGSDDRQVGARFSHSERRLRSVPVLAGVGRESRTTARPLHRGREKLIATSPAPSETPAPSPKGDCEAL